MNTYEILTFSVFAIAGLYAIINYIIVLIKDKNKEIKIKARTYYFWMFFIFYFLAMLNVHRI